MISLPKEYITHLLHTDQVLYSKSQGWDSYGIIYVLIPYDLVLF